MGIKHLMSLTFWTQENQQSVCKSRKKVESAILSENLHDDTRCGLEVKKGLLASTVQQYNSHFKGARFYGHV